MNDRYSPPVARVSRPVVGLVAGGLGAYWPQFPGLLDTLTNSSRFVAERLEQFDVTLIDTGFISDAHDAARVAEELRRAGCDLIIMFMTTYMTASMVLPIAQRTGADMVILNLQPTESMDHAHFDTGAWLAYCGACPLPEVANTFERAGLAFRSISGFLRDERAWAKLGRWVSAAGVRRVLRTGRHGLMGHLYPGMLDVSTDLTLVSTQLGGHVEVLEYDDLRVRVMGAPAAAVAEKLAVIRSTFDMAASVTDDNLEWSAQVAVGLDALVNDFELDSLAYYHRGLEDEIHEQVAAGVIVGASLLTASHIPSCGEYELRTSLAMLMADRLGAGGSFTELQALNFTDGVVEMGHDGPAHLAISQGRPILRHLGTFHGKRGQGVSVEFDVAHGPVTVLGLTQLRDGRFRLVVSEGESVAGPLLQIGNTTSRIDFNMDPGEWCDKWAQSRVAHHWALATGHIRDDVAALAELLDIDMVTVS